MAAKAADAASAARQIISEVDAGVFAPVYLLMGEESYYIDSVAGAIIDRALPEDERDFNQFVHYGLDSTVDDIIGNARRYPMFAQRTLVVVREAQMMKGIEDLSLYMEDPLESTVLVIIYRGSLDRRKALYKSISKVGRILESNPLRDYEMPGWIISFFNSKGLTINAPAAALLAEFAGTDMTKIAIQSEKIVKNLPQGVTEVSLADIEENVGLSREFSIFELTKQLSYRDAAAALRTAEYLGVAAKFNMAPATAALSGHFCKVLKYEAYLLKHPRPSQDEKSRVLGVNPYFVKDYDAAVMNYPLNKCMHVIGLIRDYDFKGKGGYSGEATQAELLKELVTKILY